MKIYVFGNPFVRDDSIPLQILPRLKQKFPTVQFEVTDPNENFPPANEKNLTILDTVKGIEKPMIFNLDNFAKQSKTPISPHDYDLLFHLLLLKKIKKIETVKIIGIPSTPFYSKEMRGTRHTGIKRPDKFFDLVYDLILGCVNGQ